MSEPKEHAEQRNLIETILRHVPGFRGYLEKEYRRDSDELARQWLADRLERSKRAIDDLTRPLADAGQIDALPQVDRLRGRLDKLIARIRGAMQGYSGFFDLVRVQEDLLDRIYQHDVQLMRQVDALGNAVEQLPALWSAAGLGTIRVAQCRDDAATIEETMCATCQGMPKVGRSVCNLERGVITGALEARLGRTVRTQETKCWGLGDSVCEFQITADPDTH